MISLPVDFEAKLKSPPGVSGGYPTQISAGDLMKNFTFASLDADPSLIEAASGSNGRPGRKLKIPALPASGTHVLGSVDGVLTWIATEAC